MAQKQDRLEADEQHAGIVSVPESLADIGDRIAGKPLDWVRYYQIEGDKETWHEVQERDAAPRLARKNPMFATVCATALDGKTQLHIADCVWIDWDAPAIDEPSQRYSDSSASWKSSALIPKCAAGSHRAEKAFIARCR